MKRFLVEFLLIVWGLVCVGDADSTAPVNRPKVGLALAAPFGDHMVLQRDSILPVWGKANPSDLVTVDFCGQRLSTAAGADGVWRIELAPTAAGGPFELNVYSSSDAIKISDVLVGDVWLCAGQSNMAFPVKKCDNADSVLASVKRPQLRIFQTFGKYAARPQSFCKGQWQLCTPETVAGFSAVAYFFGVALQEKINVPIGLVNSSYGGTPIIAWTPAEFLPEKEIPATPLPMPKSPASSIKTAAMTPVKTPAISSGFDKKSPSGLYNAMIHPLVPLALRGVIWYQGEQDLPFGTAYAGKMELLIQSWRHRFGRPQLPFLFVQIAPYGYPKFHPQQEPLLWEAQGEVARKVSHCHMVVINDIGHARNIHPRNKQEVGRRLALLALAKTYGDKAVCADFPAFRDLKTDGKKIIIFFSGAKMLKTRDGKAPSWFEIAGEDGVFMPAEATIAGSTVIVSSPKVAVPTAVRFAWANVAAPNLVNEIQLPAGAFRASVLRQ